MCIIENHLSQQANVMTTYQQIEDIATKHYSAEDQQIISVLSQQEVNQFKLLVIVYNLQ